jgi:hypothetical protein
MQSMKEKCLALYHQELAERQKVHLLEDPFARLIERECHCEKAEAQEVARLLLDIGKAIVWSGTYHTLAKAIAQAFNDEMEMPWNKPRTG